MKFSKFTALSHKWVSLFVGVQIVLWVTGGVVMSWFHITTVRGEHNIAVQTPVGLNDPSLNGFAPVPPQRIIEGIKDPIKALSLQPWMGRIVYVADLADKSRIMMDASSGDVIRPDQSAVKDVALADFAGQAGDVSIALLEHNNGEFRGPVPVWQVMMGDGEDTRIYVSPDDGRIVARRNATWRIYDFFWMLHIMDYENRTDFNNMIVRVIAGIALLGAISGFVLLFYRFRRRDFGMLIGKG